MSILMALLHLVLPPTPFVAAVVVQPSVYDSAPHTHQGLEAWAATLPYPWPQVIRCESLRDDSWRVDSDSWARGPFQFLPSTWASLGLSGDPAAYSWRFQYKEAKILAKRDGLRHSWDCARLEGL